MTDKVKKETPAQRRNRKYAELEAKNLALDAEFEKNKLVRLWEVVELGNKIKDLGNKLAYGELATTTVVNTKEGYVAVNVPYFNARFDEDDVFSFSTNMSRFAFEDRLEVLKEVISDYQAVVDERVRVAELKKTAREKINSYLTEEEISVLGINQR